MDGMGMMLKAMGVDPDSIKGAAENVQKTAQAFQEQLNRIELGLQQIDLKFSLLLSTLKEKGVLPNGGSDTPN